MNNGTRITIHSSRLEDGSEAFAVSIANETGKVTFDAITEKDATALADKFTTAVARHTCETVSVFSF